MGEKKPDPKKQLDEILARCEKATEGPWELVSVITPPSDADEGETKENLAIGDFIAHARTDVPRLAKALREVLEYKPLATQCPENEYAKGVKEGWNIVVQEIGRKISAALGKD